MKIFPEENIDIFDKPQRQSPIGVLVESGYALQKVIKAFWPVIVILLLKLKGINMAYIVISVVLILVLVVIFGYLNYRNCLFFIDEKQEEFILQKGVFNKKRIVFQLSKIQQVNINQNLIQKLAGVYAVEIETAGSAKKEAVIKAVSQKNANALRQRLMNSKSETENDAATKPFHQESAKETSAVTKVKIHWTSLFKVGITSDYLKTFGIVTALLVTLYNNIKDLWLNDKGNSNKMAAYLDNFNWTQNLLLIFVGIVLFLAIINLIRTLFFYYDFTITRHSKSLLLSYGLLNTKNTIIHPVKVQIVKVVTNFFQRKMNLKRIFIYQASNDILKDKKAIIQIPGTSDSQYREIIQLIFDAQPEKGNMMKPNYRKMIAPAIKWILLPSVIFALVIIFGNGKLDPFLFLLPVYVCLSAISIFINFGNSRLWVNEDFIIVQSGIWDINTKYLQPYKIQGITTRQNLWHVKSNIGHVILHTAGGNISFRFGNFSEINKWVNQWIYQVETSVKEWM